MSLRAGVIIALVVVLAFALYNWKRGTAPEQPPSPAASSAPAEPGQIMPPGSSDGSGSSSEPAPAMPQITPPEPADPGIAWTRPSRWMNEIAGSMRYATYIVPSSTPRQTAECAVYYFGPGKGGGVDANLERWIGEFEQLEKHDVTTREVRGMKISEVLASGAYAAHGMQGDGEALHANFSLLGAIVEGPRGDVFFKLTGPSSTVEGARKDFESMMSSLEKK